MLTKHSIKEDDLYWVLLLMGWTWPTLTRDIISTHPKSLAGPNLVFQRSTTYKYFARGQLYTT